MAASHTVWSNKEIADTIGQETIKIVKQAYKRKIVFFNGKSSRCIVGGLFYLLGFRYAVVKRQRKLADILGTSDVTIRKSYRQWLETFPDLFVDVIGKIAADKDLKYYVLLDLKTHLVSAENIRHQ